MPSKIIVHVNLLIVGSEDLQRETLIRKFIQTQPRHSGFLPTVNRKVIAKLSEQKSGRSMKIWEHNLFEVHKITKVKILDPVGCETGTDIDLEYFENADVVIIVFDFTDRHSLNSVENWHHYIKNCNDQDVPMFIVGTKYNFDSAVRVQEIDELCCRLGVRETFITTENYDSSAGDMFQIIIEAVKSPRETRKIRDLEPNEIYHEPNKGRSRNFISSLFQRCCCIFYRNDTISANTSRQLLRDSSCDSFLDYSEA